MPVSMRSGILALRSIAPSQRRLAIAFALTLVAIALRAPRLSESVFGDELYTVHAVTTGSLGDALHVVRRFENNPPLYFALAWLVHGIGDPYTWIRVPSLVAGVLTVPL